MCTLVPWGLLTAQHQTQTGENSCTNQSANLLAQNVPTVHKFYKAKVTRYWVCFVADLIDKKGIEPAIPLLDELGGWPILGDKPGGGWREEHFDLARLITTLRKYNNKVLIDMGVEVDDMNSTQHIISVSTWSMEINMNTVSLMRILHMPTIIQIINCTILKLNKSSIYTILLSKPLRNIVLNWRQMVLKISVFDKNQRCLNCVFTV